MCWKCSEGVCWFCLSPSQRSGRAGLSLLVLSHSQLRFQMTSHPPQLLPAPQETGDMMPWWWDHIAAPEGFATQEYSFIYYKKSSCLLDNMLCSSLWETQGSDHRPWQSRNFILSFCLPFILLFYPFPPSSIFPFLPLSLSPIPLSFFPVPSGRQPIDNNI